VVRLVRASGGARRASVIMGPMSSRARRSILVVEDQEDIRILVTELLELAGYGVRAAADGKSGLRLFHEMRPDLVVLDVAMPGLDGWQVLERIRDVSEAPVLMLTAHGAELERVRGLKAGADDYVEKPFGRQELLARVEALLRRAGAPEHLEAYDDGVLSVDFARQLVAMNANEVPLSAQEFKLLSAFVRHPNHVLAPTQLLELAWGDSVGRSPEQVKLYVSYLRRKLALGDDTPVRIETMRGAGYRFRPAAR
jgi:DNA-binding response OmpR family regulator